MFSLMTMIAGQTVAHAQEGESSPITNVNWRVDGDEIVITYDLKGSPDERYEVTVVMLREDVSSFRIVPQNVEGDVGVGFFAGPGRQIIWSYKKDYPAGFQGEGYFFEVRVKSASGDNSWLYYTIGATAVVGGVIAILLATKEAASVKELPFPPGRP
jgi:hypothetical protein